MADGTDPGVEDRAGLGGVVKGKIPCGGEELEENGPLKRKWEVWTAWPWLFLNLRRRGRGGEKQC